MAGTATRPEAAVVKRTSLSFVIKASRPGLWATAVWFYLLPLGGRHVFNSAQFWLGLIYVTLPLGLIIYGWNDIADADIDQFNPRKGTFLFGAKGSHEQLARLPLQIAVVQLIFATAFIVLIGAKVLLWFAALVMFTAVYNLPRHGLKSHPPFDVLNQAGYLLVFVLSSWLNHVPQLRWPAMLFGALFAMHSHVFGEVMDFNPDKVSGRRTTATVIGMVGSKFLISGSLLLETVLVYKYYADAWIAGSLAFGALWFLLDALVVWRDRPYSLFEMRGFMLGWNSIAVGSIWWVWSVAAFTR
ncbi:MAG TPA: UbiA family prenyltransferase [Terriglobales bacterium]|nr:UbiA family prenyltransferase [Terriglobales bacterium]